jgi:hypothetical protein
MSPVQPGRALALCVLAACGTGTPSPVTLSVGTTDSAGAGFYPLSGDQPLVFGAQSGFHVWLQVRIAGRAPGAVLLELATSRASDGAAILAASWPEDVDELGAEGYWQLPGPLPAFLCPSPQGVQVYDREVRVGVKLVERAGLDSLAESSAVATPHCPTGDAEELASCMSLCSGAR